MKRNLKTVIVITAILVIAVASAGYYFYNLKPKDLGKIKPDFYVTSAELQRSFEEDENVAISKYVDKVIEVSGEVSDIKRGENSTTNICLKTDNNFSSVICTLTSDVIPEEIRVGSRIVIRGVCSGYLMDVLLNNCVISGGSL